MQKWEYLQISWGRGTPGFQAGEGKVINSECSWSGPYPYDVSLDQLGEEGWELVAAVPMSDNVGQGIAGATTSLTYIFKRPKNYEN